MNPHTKYLNYTWFIFIMVLVVILAGGVVRMTQSGMGCPDWPTCFGRWIPPTNASQLPPDYEKYLKLQDIDHSFNVYHTWIEYINRLLGALLGVFIFIHFIWTYLKFRRSKKSILFLSLFLLIAVAFQGWLGKKVVDADLENVKVTMHMLVALLIAAIPLLIIYKLKEEKKVPDKKLKRYATGFLILVLLQVVLGTQVREEIDEISRPLKYTGRDTWIGALGESFYIHRSFSWLVLIGCLLLCRRAWRHLTLKKNASIIMILVSIAMILGIIMAWYSIPAIAQPLHLLAGCSLALAVFTLRLRVK